MKHSKGITLVEMLIALVILVTVFTLSSSGIITGLRVQNQNEQATSLQAKLRRINEVISQDIRGSVLGGITNEPYASSESSVSFILLDGGAGYQVLPDGSFNSATSLQILAPSGSSANDLNFAGGEALLVNGNGDAVIFDIDSDGVEAENNQGQFKISHTGCGNTVDYTPNTLLFNVRTIGFNFDKASKTLFQREGNENAIPLAFDLEDFRLDYVYVKDDGTNDIRQTPITDGDGKPLRATADSALTRLQVTLDGKSLAKNKPLQRTYSGHVGLASNSNFFLRKVIECK